MSSAIHEEHKKYKKDQKILATWMTKTSMKLDLPGSPTRGAESQPLPRTGGAIDGTSPLTAKPELEPEPTVKDLKHLAFHIANFVTTTRKLPDGTEAALSVLRSLIASRRECAVHWNIKSSRDGQDRSTDDDAHRKVIADLQNIYDILQRAVSTIPSKTARHLSTPTRTTATGGNQYSRLGAPQYGLASTSPQSLAEQIDQLAIVEAEADAVLKHSSEFESVVLDTLRRLRSFRPLVQNAWRVSDLYSATKFTLNVFALSCDELTNLQSRCGGAAEVDLCVARLRGQPTLPGASIELDDIMCVKASNILTLLLEDYDLRQQGVKTSDVRRKVITRQCEDIHPFAAVLLEMKEDVVEQAKIQRQSKLLFEHSDLLCTILLELLEHKRVTLRSTVILESYLDITEAAVVPSRNYFDTLVAMAHSTTESFAAFDRAVNKLGERPELPSSVHAAAHSCRRIAREILQLKVAMASLDINSLPPVPLTLLACFPVLSGFIMTSLMESSYLHGIFACQHNSKVTSVAHLYRATSLVDRNEQWAQLQKFIELQGKQTLGLKRPDYDTFTPLIAAIELDKALGVSHSDIEQFATYRGCYVRLQLPYYTTAGALALPSIRCPLLQIELDEVEHASASTSTRSRLQRLAQMTFSHTQQAAAHPDIQDRFERTAS